MALVINEVSKNENINKIFKSVESAKNVNTNRKPDGAFENITK